MIVEHRRYLPPATVLGVAVIAAHRAWATRRRTLAVAGFSVVVLIAIGLTLRRNADDRSDIALWNDTVVKRPENPLAHFMLAGAPERAGDVPGELVSYAEAHFKLGAALLETGRLPEAARHCEETPQIAPDFPHARANLDRVRARMTR